MTDSVKGSGSSSVCSWDSSSEAGIKWPALLFRRSVRDSFESCRREFEVPDSIVANPKIRKGNF
jgi:hypothetical protein